MLKCKGWGWRGRSSENAIGGKTTLLAHLPAILQSYGRLFWETFKTASIILLKFPKFTAIKLSEKETYLTNVLWWMIV